MYLGYIDLSRQGHEDGYNLVIEFGMAVIFPCDSLAYIKIRLASDDMCIIYTEVIGIHWKQYGYEFDSK